MANAPQEETTQELSNGVDCAAPSIDALHVNCHMTELVVVRGSRLLWNSINAYPTSPTLSVKSLMNRHVPINKKRFHNISKLSKAIRERHNTGPRSVQDIEISIVIRIKSIAFRLAKAFNIYLLPTIHVKILRNICAIHNGGLPKYSQQWIFLIS